jgi:uncharacterized delta-60 repeat protein
VRFACSTTACRSIVRRQWYGSGIDAYSAANTVVIAADGRLYIVGSAQLNGVQRCAVLRLLPDGRIDSSYGAAGVSRFAPPVGDARCERAVVLPDGKLLVVGNTNAAAFVARLNIDGSLDLRLAAAREWPPFRGVGIDIHNVALGPTSRIAVFGARKPAGSSGGAVMLADGTMDANFNGTGFYTGAPLGSEVLDGKFLADGRLVVTGSSQNAKMAVWRFNGNGTPDAVRQWRHGGVVDCPVDRGWGRSIAIQLDGKYVVGVRSLTAGNQVRYSVARLNTTGTLDGAFGTGGQTVVETGNNQGDYVYGTVLGTDGKIWLSGTGNAPGGDQAYMVARLIGTEITTNVTEFHNSTLDHYFITADPNEAAAADGGAAGPGWARTGKTFKSGGPSRVCRFYGSPDIDPATGMRRGPNSHFYTIDPAECAAVRADIGWRFESYDFSGWPRSGVACPAGTVAVLRAYNNRFAQNDSNHRYMIEQATYDAMLAQGWSGEGAVFCAPL